ncbi:MAG TPA: phenylalanine--tRNA ligase subunit beta [Parafilimonas sp.]|nr:phenylalanine--tRNA ligase subunit beta [Parafilimonas sp.]
MKISYNWLNKYLPGQIEREKLSEILTSIGLEVEALEQFENFKGGLKGLVTGEVVDCIQHPDADKLKLTRVDINNGEPLQIVCGATNVATGQKVIVAPVGATIYPLNGDAVTMKIAKIRGVESFGMICAEDEIGLSDNHEGIFILPPDTQKGTVVADLFDVYSDWIYEIGLTPNRMDAMSHIGVARDVCAWLSHHQNKIVNPKLPFNDTIESNGAENDFEVRIGNTKDCKRYSALVIKDVSIKASPAWLQNYLKAIGQRPINNIVDITNFVLHETGQPLHAFDADSLTSKRVVVKNLPEGTVFKTLDEVERKLSATDLMICNNNEPVCIAGVFGGMHSGVTEQTKNIFLESAWFSPASVRATSFKHGLRTEAAVRFEKGVDISGTVISLVRAAQLITEVAGGKIEGDIIDVYPSPVEKKEVSLKYAYLKKLSGKEYEPVTAKNILSALEFDILKEEEDSITVGVPFSKADISLPADIVEEIIRIDGINNIAIPSSITITPSIEENTLRENLKEKMSGMLAGLGFNEIVTNSITNSKNYDESNLSSSVRLLNNLSADLDILRPSMLETGLEILTYNINRKNNNLRFFELGKIYKHEQGAYSELEKICFWITGKKQNANWKHQDAEADFFTAKGIIVSLLDSINITEILFEEPQSAAAGNTQLLSKNKNQLGSILQVSIAMLQKFGIKQPVIYAELDVEHLLNASVKEDIIYKEIPQFPVVERDLSMMISKDIAYGNIAAALKQVQVKFLQDFNLFDIYESDKIAKGKKSYAINFRFMNKERTLTDAEVEAGMKTIMSKLIKDFNAEIRH